MIGRTLYRDGEKVSFDTRRLTAIALLTCMALVVSLVESAFPSPIPAAPGAKLGLSNVAPLIALIVLGVADAYLVMLLKCLLGAIMTGGLTGLMYSLPSGVISLTVETALILLLMGRMSVACISLVGAVVFNAVQLVMASLITGVNLVALLPWLMAAGVLAGAFTGLLTYTIVKRLPYSVYGRKRRIDVQLQRQD